MHSAIRTALLLCFTACLTSIYLYSSRVLVSSRRPALSPSPSPSPGPSPSLSPSDETPAAGSQTLLPPRRTVVLMTSYYQEPVDARRQELQQTVLSNLRNPHIDRVCLLVEIPGESPTPEDAAGLLGLPAWARSKLYPVRVRHQPLYSDMVGRANAEFPRSIVIIQNTDIEWDNSTTSQLQELTPNTVFALSRHPDPRAATEQSCKERQQCEDYNGSHDAFAFIAPLPAALTTPLHFRQNLWGAENRVIYELKAAGLVVLNPCKSIITTHHHCSRKRSTPKERINRQKGDRYGAFYKSGFAAAAKLYPVTPERLQCQEILDASYGIPFVDKDPRAMLGKNMSKWMQNAEAHLANQRQWEAAQCEERLLVPEVLPADKDPGWRSPKQIQRLLHLQKYLHPALFSHQFNKTTREARIRLIPL
uniref:Uncharacterized protein n=1 Tax=Eutreptiella gymnastica TaxID=73025 RepID=A0A7S1NX27_9EUGL|mmetsp:Transcript_97361/g.167842  ORF Transcript_97361/g.167842 Transcript_97361/m.167842 type:complete len:420 (+) Transcript_97361:34-1293(+)